MKRGSNEERHTKIKPNTYLVIFSLCWLADNAPTGSPNYAVTFCMDSLAKLAHKYVLLYKAMASSSSHHR